MASPSYPFFPATAQVFRGSHRGWDALPSIRAPVTIVAGGATTMAEPFQQQPPLAVFRAMADRLPVGRYVEVPGAGHFLPQERPEECAAAVAAALGWLPAR
jgi:pimeloyl-ACP methyl ester carboxylesterase